MVHQKAQKGFPYDNLIPVIQDLNITGQQPPAAINIGAVRRTEILDEVGAIVPAYPRVPPRNFGVVIVGVKIDIREYAIIRVPPPDGRFIGGE